VCDVQPVFGDVERSGRGLFDHVLDTHGAGPTETIQRLRLWRVSVEPFEGEGVTYGIGVDADLFCSLDQCLRGNTAANLWSIKTASPMRGGDVVRTTQHAPRCIGIERFLHTARVRQVQMLRKLTIPVRYRARQCRPRRQLRPPTLLRP
jgi:hypothetical protein